MAGEPDKKPDLTELGEKIAAGFLQSHRMSHTSVVVTAAAILDQALERAIKTKMPTLSGNLAKKIFEDFGALSSFSAKIDVAHALDITSELIHVELGKIRRMRNMFSHSEKMLSLDVEPVRTLFYQLTRPPGASGSYAEQFVTCIVVISEFLEQYLLRMGITDGLSDKWNLQKEDPAEAGPVVINPS
jgi:hypothetical protein